MNKIKKELSQIIMALKFWAVYVLQRFLQKVTIIKIKVNLLKINLNLKIFLKQKY